MLTLKPLLSISLILKPLLVTSLILISSFSYAQSKPESLQGTKLAPMTMHNRAMLSACPKSPNCVNSQLSGDEKHFIKALQLKEVGLEKNRDKLLEILNQLNRVNVVKVDKNYIKVEFTSKLLGFVDDVEFVISESHIDVRSASRVGHHDMGANRKRIERIRSLLN